MFISKKCLKELQEEIHNLHLRIINLEEKTVIEIPENFSIGSLNFLWHFHEKKVQIKDVLKLIMNRLDIKLKHTKINKDEVTLEDCNIIKIRKPSKK